MVLDTAINMPSDVEALLSRGKNYVCQYITAECYEQPSASSTSSPLASGDRRSEDAPSTSNLVEKPMCLHNHKRALRVIDYLIDPRTSDEYSPAAIVEWMKYLLSGRRLPNNFANEVKKFDTTSKCCLVWTNNFVAYRCRTCAISLCMSLCTNCFLNGKHEGHDFNMFRSVAGGACDCGDEFVMKPEGFCRNHREKMDEKANAIVKEMPPPSLVCMPRTLIPKLLYALTLSLRARNFQGNDFTKALVCDVLIYLNDLGTLMQGILCDVLVHPGLYSTHMDQDNITNNKELYMASYLGDLSSRYQKAVAEMQLKSILSELPPEEESEYIINLPAVKSINSFKTKLLHTTFLDELLFWTIMNEFPSELVTFLLKMLPNDDYKVQFSKSFVKHYFRIAMLILYPTDRFKPNSNGEFQTNRLANSVVHVSVQLFSNKNLARILCEHRHLLYVIIISLKYGFEGDKRKFSGILKPNFPIIRNIAFDAPKIEGKNRYYVLHHVVECDQAILRFHRYWPIVSDLNNLFTHQEIVLLFLEDSTLVEMWLEFVMNFQTMNPNTFQTTARDENYQFKAAFLAEFEICSTQMWTLLGHLKEQKFADLTKAFVAQALSQLEVWFKLIELDVNEVGNRVCSFHLPLHRYFATFLQHAAVAHKVPVKVMLPIERPELMKSLIAHPLQTLTCYNHIMAGDWAYNGLSIKTQALNYTQAHFCNSTIDADIFLIQMVAAHLPSDDMIDYLSNIYQLKALLNKYILNMDGASVMERTEIKIENAFTLIASLATHRVYLDMKEEETARLEIVTLLSTSDKTHSQVRDQLPYKPGLIANAELIQILNEVAEYKPPEAVEISGNLTQGCFYPKESIWLKEYDPLMVLTRYAFRKDFQSSLQRFASVARQSNLYSHSSLPWPPFRIPEPLDPDTGLANPTGLLNSRYLHALIFMVLDKAAKPLIDVSQHLLSIVIYLLEMALIETSRQKDLPALELNPPPSSTLVDKMDLGSFFPTEDLMQNLVFRFHKLKVPTISPSQGSASNKKRFLKQFFSSLVRDGMFRSSQESEAFYSNIIESQPSNRPSEDISNITDADQDQDHLQEVEEENSQTEGAAAVRGMVVVSLEGNDNQLVDLGEPEPPNEEAAPPPADDGVQITMLPNDFSGTSLEELVRQFAALSNTTTRSSIVSDQSAGRPAADGAETQEHVDDSENGGNRFEEVPAEESSIDTSSDSSEDSSSGSDNGDYTGDPPAIRAANEIFMSGFGIMRGSTIARIDVTSNSIREIRQNLNNLRPDLFKASLEEPSVNAAGSSNAANSTAEKYEIEMFNEDHTMLSLLLLIHAKLSAKDGSREQDTFRTDAASLAQYDLSSRVGDGPYFIGCLIKRFINLAAERIAREQAIDIEVSYARVIKMIDDKRAKLWPELFPSSTSEISAQADDRLPTPPNSDIGVGVDSTNINEETLRVPTPNNTTVVVMDDEPIDSTMSERKRKAMERKQQILKRFKNMQQQFIDNNSDHLAELEENERQKAGDGGGGGDGHKNVVANFSANSSTRDEDSKYQQQTYQCVICRDSGCSTTKRAFVQIVLLQSTSIIGNTLTHTIDEELGEKDEQPCLQTVTNKTQFNRVPLSDEDRAEFVQRKTYALNFEQKVDTSSMMFSRDSWLGSFNIGWCGGVHAQSCGHFMHIDCYQSFIESVCRTRSEAATPPNDLLDYSCPCCRKSANSMLPIIPNNSKFYAIVIQSRNTSIMPNAVAMEIWDLLRNSDQAQDRLANSSPEESNFLQRLRRAIEDVIMVTEPQFRNIRTEPCGESLFLFLSSIVRTNLEYLVILWRSQLMDTNQNRSCFVPFLQALSVNAKLVLPMHCPQLWAQIAGIEVSESRVIPFERKVPVILKDVSAILLQFLCALPFNIDKAYIVSLFQALLDLNFIQALVQIAFYLPEEKRINLKARHRQHQQQQRMLGGGQPQVVVSEYTSCLDYLALILTNYDTSFFNAKHAQFVQSNKKVSDEVIEKLCIKLCLPFLRIATMLYHQLYERAALPGTSSTSGGGNASNEQPAEIFKSELEEWCTLSRYIGLGQMSSERPLSFIDSIHWACAEPTVLIGNWLAEFDQFFLANSLTAQSLFIKNFLILERPSLLSLPAMYEQLFLYYYNVPCTNCNKAPKEPNLCLVCGKIICLREECCLNNNVYEGVWHSKSCGAGTAIYLAINSSTIIVVRGRRACVWGSVYLDEFGEEDRDLKRGKPLFLCKERYRLLEQQWLTHSFPYTNKRWIQHKESL